MVDDTAAAACARLAMRVGVGGGADNDYIRESVVGVCYSLHVSWLCRLPLDVATPRWIRRNAIR